MSYGHDLFGMFNSRPYLRDDIYMNRSMYRVGLTESQQLQRSKIVEW